jgi:hypothetical protein
MPPSRLHFDKRRRAWVEEPKSLLQELNDRTDDFHAGFIVGVGVGGFLSCVVMGLAALADLI